MENESILRHSELSTSRAELSGIFSCRPLAESSGPPSVYHSLVVASTYISIAPSLYLSPIDMCGLDITCCIALMGIETCVVGRSVAYVVLAGGA